MNREFAFNMEDMMIIQSWPVVSCFAQGLEVEHSASLEMVGSISKFTCRALGWARESIRQRGVWTTIKVAWGAVADVHFDWWYGTDTAQKVNARDLRAGSPNAAHAVCYQPTKAGPFRKMLKRLQLPADTVFVDYGSGKGRVLMLAAREQLSRVVGVEFSPELCRIAKRNIELYRRTVGALSEIEIVESDATAYPFKHDETVFFFFNPFDAVILVRVLERIEASLETHPRNAKLVYCTPCHAEVVERSKHFKYRETLRFGGVEFRVYSKRTGSILEPASLTA
jgi:SAM-dependent methyltransferase